LEEAKGKYDYEELTEILIMGYILLPVGLVGWQIYHYLRHDIWNSVSVVSALQWSGVKWAIAPTDWLGLHRILEWMPLSLAFVVIGILILFAVASTT
jgi:hypothetical protein